MLAATLLITGMIGLVRGSTSDRDSGGKQRSILKTIIDGLRNSGSSQPTVMTPAPSVSVRITHEGLSDLRRLHRVRALQDSENSQPLEIIPNGTFGYVDARDVVRPGKAKIYQASKPGMVEVHKLAAGSVVIAGYVRNADAQAFSKGTPSRLVLWPTASGAAKTTVSVPSEWIRSAESRVQSGELVLELSPPPSISQP
jgi:hypothetical protein